MNLKPETMIEQTGTWKEVIPAVAREIDKGNFKHGHGQRANMDDVALILCEEVGEYCQAVLQKRPADARKELLQVAAVALNFLCGTGPHRSGLYMIHPCKLCRKRHRRLNIPLSTLTNLQRSIALKMCPLSWWTSRCLKYGCWNRRNPCSPTGMCDNHQEELDLKNEYNCKLERKKRVILASKSVRKE